MDKYGVGQDVYCYPGTAVLRNLLNLRNDVELAKAERDFSELAASQISFELPPYDLPYLQALHRSLFRELYAWAGEIRTLDISKGDTRFCNVSRIEPEAIKIFASMAEQGWYESYLRAPLIEAVAESFGDLNMIHPFREGNGRAQRILYEHVILNALKSTGGRSGLTSGWQRTSLQSIVTIRLCRSFSTDASARPLSAKHDHRAVSEGYEAALASSSQPQPETTKPAFAGFVVSGAGLYQKS